jgi:hypothetical protein
MRATFLLVDDVRAHGAIVLRARFCFYRCVLSNNIAA